MNAPLSAAPARPRAGLGRAVRSAAVLTATAAVIGGFATAAAATPVPPKASSALSGTWVNVNAASRSVKQVVVTPLRSGAVAVDAFGSCSPTLCEWGRVPAIVYGSSVSAKAGTYFQTRQRFLAGGKEWSRTTLTGRVVRTAAGLRLSLNELTVFEDGSGRKNYAVTETFKRGEGQKVTKAGLSVGTYPKGAPPAMVAGLLGKWKNVASTGGLATIRISGSTAAPVVTAAGQCSPTPCGWGSRRGITYGATISSARGATVLAPYAFGFKKTQLIIRYSVVHKTPRLTVSEFNEFTDGSGRSNYAMTETFVRA
jgi:hypothetical protein